VSTAHHSFRSVLRYVAVGSIIGFVGVGSFVSYVVVAFGFGGLVEFAVGGLGVVLGCGFLGALVSSERQRLPSLLPLDGLRRNLETLVPLLYAEVLTEILADIREEHSLAPSPLTARWVVLRGCGALGTAAACQLGYSILDRITAFSRRTGSLK